MKGKVVERIRSIEVARLHIILCFAFDHHASAADIDSYREALIDCPDICHAVETSGTFDFFVEFDLLDIDAYDECLKGLVEPLPPFVTRFETCFVVRRFGRLADRRVGSDLWVPCRDGLRRIDVNQVEIVQAEGDYVRIRSGDQSWLHHTTMAAMSKQLGSADFIRIHRSTIARRLFIALLIHREGRWIAQMTDGSTYRIAKSSVPATLRAIKSGSPLQKALSSNLRRTAAPANRSGESRLVLVPKVEETASTS